MKCPAYLSLFTASAAHPPPTAHILAAGGAVPPWAVHNVITIVQIVGLECWAAAYQFLQTGSRQLEAA